MNHQNNPVSSSSPSSRQDPAALTVQAAFNHFGIPFDPDADPRVAVAVTDFAALQRVSVGAVVKGMRPI